MERRHIDLFSCNIVKFIRYVDDCLVIASSIEAVNLYNYLNNNVHSNIKFTIETNINNELPFLDMLLKIIDGRVYTSVYRKPTHTDRYLNYKSNHPPHVKNGVIKNLVHRASLHGSSFQEIENIKKAMIANDFPPKRVDRIVNRYSSQNNLIRPTRQPLDSNFRVTIPYYKGLSEKIQAMLRKHGIKTFYKGSTKLRFLYWNLGQPMSNLDKRAVVYCIRCTKCDHV